MTLSNFLLARIAEEEAVARIIDTGRWYSWDDRGAEIYQALRTVHPEAAAHIRIHSPARVLAECEAKRALVEDFEILHRDYGVTHDPTTEARRLQARIAMARAAVVYADHPDYNPEWRP